VQPGRALEYLGPTRGRLAEAMDEKVNDVEKDDLIYNLAQYAFLP
jgi:hypothetical protein